MTGDTSAIEASCSFEKVTTLSATTSPILLALLLSGRLPSGSSLSLVMTWLALRRDPLPPNCPSTGSPSFSPSSSSSCWGLGSCLVTIGVAAEIWDYRIILFYTLNHKEGSSWYTCCDEMVVGSSWNEVGRAPLFVIVIVFFNTSPTHTEPNDTNCLSTDICYEVINHSICVDSNWPGTSLYNISLECEMDRFVTRILLCLLSLHWATERIYTSNTGVSALCVPSMVHNTILYTTHNDIIPLIGI